MRIIIPAALALALLAPAAPAQGHVTDECHAKARLVSIFVTEKENRRKQLELVMDTEQRDEIAALFAIYFRADAVFNNSLISFLECIYSE